MSDDRAGREAIRWQLQFPGMGESDWDAFTDWLEADPANSRAYDAVATLDTELPAFLHAPRVTPIATETAALRMAVPARHRSTQRMALAAGLVAAVSAGLGYGFWPRAKAERIVATTAGEQRALRLADGTVVRMNGDSQLAILADARSVRLDRGEASFQVVHDAARPFQVYAGSTLLQDVGTYFDLSWLPGGVEVAVAEGAVAYDPQGANVVVTAGQAARVHGQPATIEIRAVDHASVGGWQTYRLVYRGATLDRIALDLDRSLGRRIQVDPSIASHVFTGTLLVNGDNNDVRTRIEGMLGVDIVGDGPNWRFNPAARASRAS